MLRFHLPLVLAIAPSSILLIQSACAGEIPPTNTGVQLQEFSRRATTVKDWFAQIKQTENSTAVEVTKVQINRTENGLEIILETQDGKPLQIDTEQFTTSGNTLIANIPNAVLKLAEGNEFSSNNPTADISRISINQIGSNSLQIAVVGTNRIPTNVTLRTGELAYNLRPMGETRNVEIVVTRTPRSAYIAPIVTTGTRTDTPLRDVPQSVQAIPRQVLQDQNAAELGEAIRNISGVSQGATSTLTSFPDQFIIRGFQVSNFNGSNYINGIRRRGVVFSDPANIEQVEVLKGPASVLFGQAEPGGVINTVTKQPLNEPYYAAELTIGSFDLYRPAIDLSGPINGDRTLRYRLNAAYRSAGSFVDFVESERIAVAPVVTFDFSENTTITIEAEHLRNSTPDYDGIPAVGSVLPNPFGKVPDSRFIDDPEIKNQNYYNTQVNYRFQHRFSDNWTIRNAFKAEFWDTDEGIVSPSLAADNRTVNRTAFLGETHADYYTLQTDLIGKVETGIVKQEFLFGVDLFRSTSETVRFSARLPALDLFNPVYERGDIPFTTRAIDSFETQNSIGVYFQDLVSIGEQVKILLGGRFDWVEQTRDDRLTNLSTDRTDTAFSPRVGIVYQPIQPVSLYASYSRSFLPTGLFSINADGTTFIPTTGEQFEVGVKTEFLNGRLSATVAAYQITKQNIVVPDPDRPTFSIQIGEQQSKGIELSVAGQILPGLNLIAGYAYTDAEFTEDPRPAFKGNQPNNVPRHNASLWASYEIQSGNLQGLGFGAGVFFIGERQGDLANTFELPNYLRTDAAIFYRRDNWRVGLNFKNLFNVDYYEAARDRNAVFPGAPFTVQGTVSVQF